MKKLIGIGIAVSLILSLAASGCSTKPKDTTKNTNEKASVSFWAACISQDRDTFYKGLVTTVKEKYPNITLNYLGVPGDISAYYQKLDMAIAADTAPDITNSFGSKYIANGYYLALDNYFNNWSEKDNMNQSLISAIRNYDTVNKKLYAIPSGTNVWIMWERTDLLNASGLKTPTTWDDFFNDIAKMTDKSKDQYGLSIRGGAGSANTLEMLMYDYSGITSEFDKNGKSTINDPKNVEFVEKYLGAYNVYSPQDDLTKGWTQLASTFQSGKAAFVFHNLGSGSAMDTAFKGDTSKYAAVAWPMSAAGYNVSEFMPDGASISSKSKVKDAAWDVVALYEGQETQVQYAKLYAEIPGNSKAMTDTFFTNTPYMKTGVDFVNAKTTKVLDAPFYMPEYTSVQTQVEPLVQKVMTKQMTAQAMLDQWAALMDKARSDYMASLKSGSSSGTSSK